MKPILAALALVLALPLAAEAQPHRNQPSLQAMLDNARPLTVTARHDSHNVQLARHTSADRAIILWQAAEIDGSCRQTGQPRFSIDRQPARGQLIFRPVQFRWTGTLPPHMAARCAGVLISGTLVYYVPDVNFREGQVRMRFTQTGPHVPRVRTVSVEMEINDRFIPERVIDGEAGPTSRSGGSAIGTQRPAADLLRLRSISRAAD